MIIDKKIIGKKIRQIRIEKGFSQEELSEKIDISPRHMCTIENGKSFPSLETFVNIASILDIDINNFFNLNIINNHDIRNEISDLIQISSQSDLKLYKKILEAIIKNK